MAKGIIQLCYRKLIDASSTGTWEKYVFDDTHREFYMQAQQFDQAGSCATFHEILKQNPKADQMHYLVSTAAIGYIRQLQEKIPGVLNVFGSPCVAFRNFRFEIVQSHIRNKALHRVAIYFYSDALTWIDTIPGQHLLVAPGNHLDALSRGEKVDTEMIAMMPNLSICSYQQIDQLSVPLKSINSN